jgi:hypothetical protein
VVRTGRDRNLDAGAGAAVESELPGGAESTLAPAGVDPGVFLGYPPGRPGVAGATHVAPAQDPPAIIYAAVAIGEDFETGHPRSCEENRIGSHCTLGTTRRSTTARHRRSRADSLQRLHRPVPVIGRCIPGAGVTIANDPHPICTKCMGTDDPPRRYRQRQRDILPLIRSAKMLVGAGSIVTADVPAGMLVAGNQRASSAQSIR